MLQQNTVAAIKRAVERHSGELPDQAEIADQVRRLAAAVHASGSHVISTPTPAERERWLNSEQLAADVRELVRLALVVLPDKGERERLSKPALDQVQAAEGVALNTLADVLAGAFADAHAAKVAAAAEAEARSVRRAKSATTLLEQLDAFSTAFQDWAAEAREPDFKFEVEEVLAKIRRRAA